MGLNEANKVAIQPVASSDCHPTAGLDSNYLSQSEPDEYRVRPIYISVIHISG